MQTALSRIDDLKFWFEQKGASKFTLYSQARSERIIHAETTADSVESAWDILERNVVSQARTGQAYMRVFVPTGKAGNTGHHTNISIDAQEVARYTGVGTNLPAVAGINGTAALAGYVKLDEVDQRIEAAREKWDMEARIAGLESALDEKRSNWEKVGDLVGNNPQLAGIANNLIAGIIQRFGAPVVVAGTSDHAAQNGEQQAAQSDTDGEEKPYSDTPEDEEFQKLLDEIVTLLDTDDMTLIRKLHALVVAQPGMAKSLLQ